MSHSATTRRWRYFPKPSQSSTARKRFRIDGTTRRHQTTQHGLVVSVSPDPVLVLYQSDSTLPDVLESPRVRFIDLPTTQSRRTTSTVVVQAEQPQGVKINLIVPPLWSVRRDPKLPTPPAAGLIRFELTPPAHTSIREAALTVTFESVEQPSGELTCRVPCSD